LRQMKKFLNARIAEILAVDCGRNQTTRNVLKIKRLMTMSKTKISWADMTYNPITGCSHVSEGCQNCYAEAWIKRMQKMGVEKYRNGFKPKFHFNELERKFPGKGKKIFVGSMGDLFHWDFEFPMRNSIINKIKENPQHIFILCTKRTKYMAFDFSDFTAPENCWLLTSAENQARLDERLPWLLKCDAEVKGISLEPLLEPVDISHGLKFKWACSCGYRTNENIGKCKGYCFYPSGKSCDALPCPKCGKVHCWSGSMASINWVIIGCESGANRRPCKLEWVESIVEQCKSADVAVWVKQLDIGGKVVKDIKKFPEHLRIREFPA